uniref:Uncharacterized 13.3 kDa protein in rpl23-rpl2 intergenic region n=1 Tax=Euglena longa TaxID=3037 RepID=YCX6_EUGLO|nr:hypothetical protein AsloCp23 [Euglena longa]P34780.1 RecName: Full=Uncharacterized 13.3 kDa protein in rpl23-rpl2 intergenic region; AltName: Full=ORF105 [Euglena longa]CAC24594.1 hypothetical protein [Euglena longa]
MFFDLYEIILYILFFCVIFYGFLSFIELFYYLRDPRKRKKIIYIIIYIFCFLILMYILLIMDSYFIVNIIEFYQKYENGFKFFDNINRVILMHLEKGFNFFKSLF